MATTTKVHLPGGVPVTHPAVVTVGLRAPLQFQDQPTEAPGPGEVLVHVLWTSSTPLDLHQADGAMLKERPFVMGSSFGGSVVALGAADPANPAHHAPGPLAVGDAVFGFAHRSPREKGFQTYLTTAAYMCSRLPASWPARGLGLRDAVTVPANLVTVFHTVTHDMGLPLPWPVRRPAAADADAAVAHAPILVWGAASSVGCYALQVLRHWGFDNVLAVASARHHAHLRELGAAACFDYAADGVVEEVLGYVSRGENDRVGTGKQTGPPRVPYILDCIGSLEGTLRPLTRIAERGTRVAIMLPVINVHASDDQAPEYEMDVSKVLVGEWKEGVELRGARTHFYLQNEFFKDHLQSEIVPALLEEGIVTPNKIRVVEGKTLLERAENALSLLRNRAPSGEKLVWRVAEDE